MERQDREEERTVQELKLINNQLYKFAMQNVLSSCQCVAIPEKFVWSMSVH